MNQTASSRDVQADIGEIAGEGDVGAYVTFRTEKDARLL